MNKVWDLFLASILVTGISFMIGLYVDHSKEVKLSLQKHEQQKLDEKIDFVIELEDKVHSLEKENKNLKEENRLLRIAKNISDQYKTISTEEAYSVIRLVIYHSKKNNLDPDLIIGMIGAESSFRTYVDSHAGAKGLMQIIPRWHQDKISGRNVYDIEVNIEVGTRILAHYLERARGDLHLALGMYNGTRNHVKIKSYIAMIERNSSIVGKLSAI